MSIEVGTAYVTLLPSARGFQAAAEKELSGVGSGLGNTLSTSMGSSLTKATGKGGVIGKAMSALSGAFGGGFLGGLVGSGGLGNAFSLVTGAVGGFVREAQESQKVASQTAAVLKSTGGAAKVSAQQVSDLATALSLKGVDDEVIQSGENVLLTFTKVANQVGKGNDVFNQATSVALDMSRALDTDLQGSVIQVGKALNDPIKGITALQRVGVSFTESQKAQIKALVDTGDTLGAQKIILQELNTEFGGAAAASATSSDKLKVAWGNVQEQLGNALLPILNKVSDWLVVELPKATVWAQNALASFQDFWSKYGDEIMAVVNVLVTTFTIQIKAIVAFWKAEWITLTAVVDFTRNYVVNPIITAVTTLVNFLTPAVQAAVADVRAAWSVLSSIYTFFRDNVAVPIGSAVGTLRDTVRNTIQGAVDSARTAWSGLAAIYTFFVQNVQRPIESAIGSFTSGIRTAFDTAVTAVKLVWDGLKRAVGAPINVVIGFYNVGIAGLWNFIATKVGLPKLDPISPLKLAVGGTVPGRGTKDTVRAMLTPGEAILTAATVKRLGGAQAIDALNNPKSSIDPAVLGYAGGGVVKSIDATQAFARQQAGKPYVFAAVGPNAFDCSGFTSALVNFVLGLMPWSRRHTSGTVGADPALRPGDGGPRGLTIGAAPPYMLNHLGDFVGHTTSTIANLNAEATPPAVRVGGNARGANALPQQYMLPGFGGPNADEQGIIDVLKSLLHLKIPGLGGSEFSDMLKQLIVSVPKAIYDFLITKVPQIVKDAIVDVGISAGAPNPVSAAVGVLKAVTPFLAKGGRIRRDGPILAGERGPEILWGSRGEYMQANGGGVAPGGGALIGTLVNNRRDLTPNDLAQALQIARLQMVA